MFDLPQPPLEFSMNKISEMFEPYNDGSLHILSYVSCLIECEHFFY